MAITSFKKLDEIILLNFENVKKDHETISDTLVKIIKDNNLCYGDSLYKAELISKAIESAMWASDSEVDNQNLTRYDRVRNMIVVWTSLSILPLLLKEDYDKYIAILDKLFKIKDLHEKYEPESISLAKQGKLEDAIYSILEGKSLNAYIYVEIFKLFCNIDDYILSEYISFRKLQLLVKDLRDFDEDIKNGDISASTIIYTYIRYHPYGYNSVPMIIKKIANNLLSNIRHPALRKTSINLYYKLLYEDLPRFLQKMNRYLELQSYRYPEPL